MKKMKLWLLASKIEWHWWFIMRIRGQGNSLLENGMPLSSQRLYTLNKRLSKHSTKALRAQSAFEILAKS